MATVNAALEHGLITLECEPVPMSIEPGHAPKDKKLLLPSFADCRSELTGRRCLLKATGFSPIPLRRSLPLEDNEPSPAGSPRYHDAVLYESGATHSAWRHLAGVGGAAHRQ